MQGEDPGYAWAMTVLGFWLKLVLGVLGSCLSVAWLLQVILYVFLYPPITPLLNDAFVALDGVFPLFGTLAFAVFCFYLIGENRSHPSRTLHETTVEPADSARCCYMMLLRARNAFG